MRTTSKNIKERYLWLMYAIITIAVILLFYGCECKSGKLSREFAGIQVQEQPQERKVDTLYIVIIKR